MKNRLMWGKCHVNPQNGSEVEGLQTTLVDDWAGRL